MMAFVAGCGPFGGAGGSPAPFKTSALLMDTLIQLTVYGPVDTAQTAATAALAAMKAVEDTASFYKPDSELTRLNRDRSLRPSPRLAGLLHAASAAVEMSGGVFDPTFSALYEVYGFYDKIGRRPTRDELSVALARTGWSRHVSWDGESVHLASGVRLDLGGIAGGLAVEEAAAALRAASATTFFIDDSGDLWMEGGKPDGRPWNVAVKDPRGGDWLARVESVDPVAISTSGDYERFVEIEGVRLNHIFDPRTGLPAAFYQSVTVIASRPIDADVLSTTLFALSPAEADEFCRRHHIPALFLGADGTTWLSEAGPAWFRTVKGPMASHAPSHGIATASVSATATGTTHATAFATATATATAD
jgi:FAD:protein FMN transferase